MSGSIKKSRILIANDSSLLEAVKLLRNQQVVAIPTETVYGLAGVLSSDTALTKIFEAKERPSFDPLIVHVELEKPSFAELMKTKLVDADPLSDHAVKVTDQLIRKFWPGPLTLILPKTENVSDLATSGMPTVAIRMPAHPVTRSLLKVLNEPLCAPSANRFGRISPTSAKDVMEELGDRIELIVDGGDCTIGVESTIVMVDPENGTPYVLRPGGVAIEDIEACLGKKVKKQTEMPKGEESMPIAPGMLKSHYAPEKTLQILKKPLNDNWEPPFSVAELPQSVGVLAFFGNEDEIKSKIQKNWGVSDVHVRVLAQNTGDWSLAAKNLFKALRELDATHATQLWAEPCFETQGLGYAIADRLKRASI